VINGLSAGVEITGEVRAGCLTMTVIGDLGASPSNLGD
jgi:hypothetical protein